MPEFRQDPLLGRWVIIAEDRANRPSEFVAQLPRRTPQHCPFCVGSEHETPEAIAVYSIESQSNSTWQIRVIPNKYPAVTLRTDSAPEGVGGLFRRQELLPEAPVPEKKDSRPLFVQPGLGVHEVIIESPCHVASFTELTDELAAMALRAYQDRLLSLAENTRLNYGLLFKNCRGGSGATLEHVHSQLLATSIVPTEIEQELRSAACHLDQTGQCAFCELLKRELAVGARIAQETDQFVALCPFASRFPYETWILPRAHGHRFELADPSQHAELAALLQLTLRLFESLSAQAAYNFWIRTAPFRAPCEKSFHWRMELIPRVTTQAGYEWGTGCFVNPVAPETAAHRLRQA